MSKLKKKLGRRILAYILSGAMIMSCMPSSNMTAFASELPEGTGGGYYEETVEADGTDSEDDAEAVESEEDSQGDSTVSGEKEDAETQETVTSSEETDAVDTEASDEEAVEIETTASTEETDSEIKKEADDNKEGEDTNGEGSGDATADADGFYNGLEVSEVAAGASYYYDFTGEEFKGIPNSYEKGLFSFNAGNYNAASYNGTKYGIEFKSGNKLTFQVSGNSYIVVGGDNNNNCTDLAASSSTGTLSPETATTKTSGHATLTNCKERGDNTVVYEYEGEQGTVTLTVDPSYTKAEGQTSTKAYIAYVCVIPKEEGGEDEPVADEDGFYNGLEVSEVVAGASYYYDFTGEEFKGIPNSYEKGLFSFNAGNYNAASYNGTKYGIEFKSGNKLTFQVSGNSYIVVGGDNNNNCTDLAASSSTGTLSPETATTKTSGHATLANCKERGDNTVVYEYAGEQGTVTLTVDPSYTKVEGQTSTKAYIAYVCVIPKETSGGDEEQPDEDGFYNGLEAKTVAAGRPYYYDFTEMTDIANSYEKGLFSFDAGSVSAAVYHSKQHGVEFKTGNKLTFKVSGDSYIVVGGNNNSNCADLAASSSSGTLSPETNSTVTSSQASLADCKVQGSNTLVYEYTGSEGAVTLTLNLSNGQSSTKAYIAYVCVIPKEDSGEVIDEANNFKEWLDDLAVNGTVATGTHEYGGGNVTLVGQGETQFTVYSSAENVERDGETHNGYKAGNRHTNANAIPSIPTAGEGCCVEFESKTTGMFKMYFWSTSFLRVWDFDTETGMSNGYTDSETAADFYAFNTKPGHTYVMSTTGKTNNMAFIGYEYVQNMDVEVTVAVNNVDADESALSSLELTLTDAALGTDKGVVKQNTTSVKLLKNHTYTITSNDGGVKALVSGEDSFTATGDAVTFDLYNVPNVKLTGEITGTGVGTVTKLTFENMVNGSLFEAEIKDDNTYSCDMKPGEYNTSVETTNGGKTYDRVSVKSGEENVNEVYVEVPDPSKYTLYSYTDIETLATEGEVGVESGKAHCVAQSGAKIVIPVKTKSKVTISAYFKAAFTMDGVEKIVDSGSTSQIDTFTTEAESDVTLVFSDTSFLLSIEVAPVVAFKSELSVPGDYDTLNEAFDAIAAMENRPEGEEGRVTVTLNKDIREQTVVNAPYVTLKGNNHTIDWYYGVGTLYYSVDPSTGLYNERLARDRYSSAEGNGNLWGGAFIVRGDNFIAEDTIFKNTYNYELTEEEKTDIAGSTLSVSRLDEGADVAASAYKERSNAFYIEADNIECYNCKILSSQDTLGRNGSTNNGYHTYFKNCVIGGNVDYICGEFAAVFDNCELQWKTLSDKGNDKVGYIVAPKTNPYVFRNCKVTLDNSSVTGVLGYYGRTWGAGSKAAFINTETNGYINADGWGEMGSGEGATAVFKEYNNTKNGEAFVTKGAFCSAENQTADAVKDYIDTDEVSAVNTVLGGWTPVHYSGESNSSVVETPEASPAAGAVAVGTKVTLTSKTEGAAIYYTTNGDAPTTGSKLYTDAEPIIITEAVIIKAIAVKEGFTDSEVATFEYTISDKPVDPDVPVVTTIQLSDCAIAVPSILADSKKNPNNETSTSVVYYTSKDKDGNPTNPVRFAEGLDYKVQWKGLKTGTENTYSVTITGLGRAVDQYKIDTASTITKEYKVFDKSDKSVVNLSKAKITLDSSAKNAVYTGYAITPAVTEVKVGKEVIPATKYKVSYKSNINAGKATVIVTADSDAEYAEGESFIIGSKTVNFTIKKAAINKNQVTVTALDRSGKEFGSEPYAYRGIDAVEIAKLSVVSSEGKALKENIDYTVTYKNNRKAGKATATIKGIGSNISGSLNIPFTITPLDIGIDSPYKISTVPSSLQYSPSGAKLGYICVYNDNDEIYLEEGVDFKVTYTYADKKTKAAGTTVDFVGKGINACKGSFSNKDTVFTIQKAYFADTVYLSNAVIVDETKSEVTGDKLQKALEKAAVVYDAYGTKLKVKKDYSVTPTTIDGKDVITISPADTVKDNYYGEYNSCSYYYYRAKNIAKLKKVEFAKDYVLLYDGRNPVELTEDDIKALGTYEFVLGKDVEIVEGSYKNNYKAGTASVTIRGISQNGYYGTKTIKFKIKEA